MRLWMKAAMLAVVCVLVTSCETLKPYEKEHLLDAAMDEAATLPLASELMPAASSTREKLAGGPGGGGGATSCPTCGG